MPDTVRGTVLGFSSYVQDRTVALCLSFGSPSTGFATALARVFIKVSDWCTFPVHTITVWLTWW